MKNVNVIEDRDWDDLVRKTYGKPYCFQQQDECKSRGVFYFSVPCEIEDYQNDLVPEKVNGPDMGVSFSAWLARDTATRLSKDEPSGWELKLWWERNFYPHVSVIANDLHEKGLLQAGDYAINIDW